MEAKFGIKGFSEMQGNLEKISTEKSVIDEKKSEHLQKMSETVQELHEKIATKKMDLAPLVKSMISFIFTSFCYMLLNKLAAS